MIGTSIGVVWAFGGGLVAYGLVRFAIGLRLTAEEEHNGADLSIHRIGSTPEREVSW